jgi:GntR family transcriptional regulator
MTRVPLYHEVQEKLIQALAAGEWKPGEKIPIERDLARRYDVGISTIRAAANELEAAGILSRRQGKGTFVSEHTSPSRLYRFFNLVNGDGTRETPLRAFASLRRDRPTPVEREALQLSRYGKRDDVYRLRSTFSLNGGTVGVSDATVPAGLFPKMTKAGVSDGKLTLYALYQSNYNVNVISVSADLAAARAPEDVARLLRVKIGSPVLRIERMAYTYGDVPVERRTTWVNTSDCKFHVDQGSTV